MNTRLLHMGMPENSFRVKDCVIMRSVRKYKTPRLKRVFDVVFSLSAILILIPAFVIIAAGIRFESKGRIFYFSQRVGGGFRIFRFYKFRSMCTGADKKVDELRDQNQYLDAKKLIRTPSNGLPSRDHGIILFNDNEMILEDQYLEQKEHESEESFFKVSNDPRITRFGRFIRKTSLDELPQLFNVLKGDMSLVGNRPLPLYEAEQLTTDHRCERFLAPAGITGLWQVSRNKRSGKISADERIRLDIEYAREHTFRNDMKILLKTVSAMIQHENE